MNTGSTIRFSFDRQKFVTVMQLLGQKTPSLDILKAVKLLYLIDREHLRGYGRPVLGDQYVAMEHGPVPSESYDILKSVRSNITRDLPIRVERTISYPIFVPTEDPEMSYLSDAEVESINKTIEQYGEKTGWELREITHLHATWTEAQGTFFYGPSSIDYKLFFSENPEECRNAYEAMILEQADRDFADGI